MGRSARYGCHQSVALFRQGVPAEELEPSDEPVQYAVDKLLVRDELNTLYADGGQFKSWTALLLALSITQGITLPGGLASRVRGPVLYVDAETSRPTFARRLAALMRGLELRPTTRSGIYYHKLERPLVDAAGTVRNDALRVGAVLVVVDSFSWAIGSMPMLDAALPFMNVMQRLPGTKLLLNHVSKASADQKARTRALGTVAMMNGPRNA
jgi:RecA-family ATPase